MPFSAPTDEIAQDNQSGFSAPADELIKPSQDDLRQQQETQRAVKPATTLGQLPSVIFTPSEATIERAKWQVEHHIPERVDVLGSDANFIPPTTPQDIATLTGKNPESRAAKNIASTVSVPGQFANTFATPEGALMLASPAAGAAFVTQMAAQVPAKLGQAVGAYSGGDKSTGDAALIDGLVTAGLLTLPALHAFKAGKSLDEIVGPDTANELRQNVVKQNEAPPQPPPAESINPAPAPAASESGVSGSFTAPPADAVAPPAEASGAGAVKPPTVEPSVSGDEIGKQIGAKFDSEFDLGKGPTRQFTFTGDNFEGDKNTPHYGASFSVPADWTPEQVKAKAQDVIDSFANQGEYSIKPIDGKYHIVNPKGVSVESFDKPYDAVKALGDYNKSAEVPSKIEKSKNGIDIPKPDLSLTDNPVTESDFPKFDGMNAAAMHAGTDLKTGEPLYWVVRKVGTLKSANPKQSLGDGSPIEAPKNAPEVSSTPAQSPVGDGTFSRTVLTFDSISC